MKRTGSGDLIGQPASGRKPTGKLQATLVRKSPRHRLFSVISTKPT